MFKSFLTRVQKLYTSIFVIWRRLTYRTSSSVKQLPQAPLSSEEQAQNQITIKAAALQKIVLNLNTARKELISLKMSASEDSAYRGQSPQTLTKHDTYAHLQQTISKLERALFIATAELEETKKYLQYLKSRPAARSLPKSPRITPS